MRLIMLALMLPVAILIVMAGSAASAANHHPIAMAIHGSAGTISPKDMTPALENRIPPHFTQAGDEL